MFVGLGYTIVARFMLACCILQALVVYPTLYIRLPSNLKCNITLFTMSPIPVLPIVINCCMSALGCMATIKLIPAFKDHFIAARLYGMDLNKTSKKEM